MSPTTNSTSLKIEKWGSCVARASIIKSASCKKNRQKKKGSLFREAKWVRTKPCIPRDWSTGWWWKKYRKQHKYPSTSYCIGVQNRTNCEKQRKRIL
jgi:hypothetical protein